ncbi:MAG: chloride channel protein [Trueperaceae bacterium]|nr:chloride channel protein [Trueperaceae bacterium]
MASEPAPLIAGLRARLDRARLADGTMLALAALTGVVTGLFAAAMIWLVRLVERVAFGTNVTMQELLLMPAAGAVGVWAISRLAPEVTGSGVVTTMESLAVRNGRLRARLPWLQVLATGLALGTGASGGREAPIVLVGGSVGSAVARRFHLTEEQLRSLVAAGAAAGIGAAFNAPIGGMLFAIEVIVGGLRSKALQVIVISSVAGSVVARQLVGDGIIYAPAFDYGLRDPRELLLYLAVGLAAALLAAVIIWGDRWAQRLFEPVRRVGGDLGALALGGAIVGVIALAVPEVLGDGKTLPPINGIVDPIQELINGGFGVGWGAVSAIAVLLVAKFAASLATNASRSAVGWFAPTLFLGAALGSAIATATLVFLPESGINPGAYALVGMAAAYGATARAPLTAILIVFELSGDYGLVLPLMLAVGVATWLADKATPGSMYTLPLRDRGIVYAEPDDVDLLQTVHVEEVMTTGHPTVRPSVPLEVLQRRFETERTHGFAVVSGGVLQGVVTLTDLARADNLLADGMRPASTVLVQDLMTTDVLTTSPSDAVFTALQRMASIDVGRIPVTTGNGTYLGMLRRGDLVDAYRLALQRGADRQHSEDRASLRELTGMRFLELTIADGSPADGTTVADLAWPTSAVLTSITRGTDVVVPRGDVTLQAGDDVVVLASHEEAEAVRSLVGRYVEA